MYLIPSFILIPVVLIALYLFNRHNDKKMQESIDKIIAPIPDDALLNTLQPLPEPIQKTHLTPSKAAPKLTPEQRIATQERIKKLKASLKSIQDKKLN